jgi:hydroxymethylglutaryl-CoA reductase
MAVEDSRISGLYRLEMGQRTAAVAAAAKLSQQAIDAWKGVAGLDDHTANSMIENVVGTMALPVGIATNFIIDGKPKLIPFCVEESSIVAAASNIAKRALTYGGFTTNVDPPLMIGQIQVVEVDDIEIALDNIHKSADELIAICNDRDSTMIRLGGGCKRIEARRLETASGDMVIVHIIVDTRDAMGANAVNSMAEQVAPRIAELTGGRALLRILSNLANHRLARSSVRLSPADLSSAGDVEEGKQIISDIILANDFAQSDPWRAATQNKGIMNAISAVGLACGQDWRALEAGAHAWASMSGHYRSLTEWNIDGNGCLCGSIELPLAVGIVGGASTVHPVARANLELLDVNSSQELAGILASAGLAQNLAAMRALCTAGIQRGHMNLHLRNMVIAAGAVGSEVEALITRVRDSGLNITQTVVDNAFRALNEAD